MATLNITTTPDTFTLAVDGTTAGTWDRVEDIDEISFDVTDRQLILSLPSPYFSTIIRDTDTIKVGGVTQSGMFRGKALTLRHLLLRQSEGGPGISIPETAYASNAEAVAALGVGKLYRSATNSLNGSPFILITI